MFNAGPLLVVDSFNAAPLALYTLLFLGTLAAAPAEDRRAGQTLRLLIIWFGAVLCYLANHPLLFWAGWALSFTPLLLNPAVRRTTKMSALGGTVAMAAALLVMSNGGAMEWAFAFLMLAVAQRKGIIPFHTWFPSLCERGDLLEASLLFNGHLGAVAIARIALPAMPVLSRSSLGILADVGLVTAVFAAILALGDRQPRRMLALVATSQAATILAGLEGMNETAILGALLHWMVVSASTTALLMVLRMVEVRHRTPITGQEYLGLGGRFPRLAVFFLAAGVALVGLPGTLGFASEEMLLHGALESHPWIGLALPIATAVNAISLFRLFSHLFLGERLTASTVIPDARLRERGPLAVLIVLLIAFGLFPQWAIQLREEAADSLTRLETPAR